MAAMVQSVRRRCGEPRLEIFRRGARYWPVWNSVRPHCHITITVSQPRFTQMAGQLAECRVFVVGQPGAAPPGMGERVGPRPTGTPSGG